MLAEAERQLRGMKEQVAGHTGEEKESSAKLKAAQRRLNTVAEKTAAHEVDVIEN